jgi:hypothetical protein
MPFIDENLNYDKGDPDIHLLDPQLWQNLLNENIQDVFVFIALLDHTADTFVLTHEHRFFTFRDQLALFLSTRNEGVPFLTNLENNLQEQLHYINNNLKQELIKQYIQQQLETIFWHNSIKITSNQDFTHIIITWLPKNYQQPQHLHLTLIQPISHDTIPLLIVATCVLAPEPPSQVLDYLLNTTINHPYITLGTIIIGGIVFAIYRMKNTKTNLLLEHE